MCLLTKISGISMKQIFFSFYFISLLSLFLRPDYLYCITQEDLLEFLSKLDNESVEIIQHKYVSSIDKTFSTYSLARFEKDKGFIFKHNEDTFISTKEKYCYNKEPSKALKDLPYFSDIKTLIDTLMSSDLKDTKSLEKIFDLSYGKYLVITPKNQNIKKWIKKISIHMKFKKIDVVEILYQNKNKITLQLKPTKKVIKDEISC